MNAMTDTNNVSVEMISTLDYNIPVLDCKYKKYWHLLFVCDGTTFAILWFLGPAPAPEDDEDLLPQDHGEVWTQDQQVQEEEAGHVLLPLGGVYWESPSTAVPTCSEAKKCQLLSISVQLYCSAALHGNQT